MSIAGVFWRAARPGELAYRHTRTPETARRHAQSFNGWVFWQIGACVEVSGNQDKELSRKTPWPRLRTADTCRTRSRPMVARRASPVSRSKGRPRASTPTKTRRRAPSRRSPYQRTTASKRRECVICARTVEYEDPAFPVCDCGRRVYCGEACQAQDWTAGHSLLCASRPDASAEPLDALAAAVLDGSDSLDGVEDI